MVIKTIGKRSVFLTLLTLIMAGTLITAGCSGGGGGGLTGSTGETGSTGDSGSTGDTGGAGDTGSTVAKATLSGTLLTSSSSGGSSLFRRLGKAAAADSGEIPAIDATVLCFDTDSVSTAAAGSTTTDSTGNWTIDELDAGNYACFGIYIDPTSLTVKTTKLDDIAASAGETVTVDSATVESDTTSPTIVSVLSDNVADTSLSDGDPDPLYEISDVLPGQVISVIFNEAMNTSTMAYGTGAVLKDSSGAVVPASVAFNASGTEFRYIPDTPLTAGEHYTLYLSNRVRDLSNNGINDPDSDSVVALARLTVVDAEDIDAFANLSANPKDGDTGVNVYQDVTITFNRPVDFVSFKENTTISPPISGRIEPTGDGVTIFHSAPLAAGTDYTITIGADVADLAGNTLGTPVSIAFSTGAALDTSSVEGIDHGGGTADDVVAILASITKAELAVNNQDIITFASFFSPDFTFSMRQCHYEMATMPADGAMPADSSSDTMTAALEGDSGTEPVTGTGGGETCGTETLTLQEFLDMMKKDFIEERNMAKGFGEVERMFLLDASGNRMSVEHFNSDFDSGRNPVGADLYVGWPNPIPGIHFVDAQIDATDSWGNIWSQYVKYMLDPDLASDDMRTTAACSDVTDPTQEAGTGQVLVTYRKWDPLKNNEIEVTQICDVVDGDGDETNEWTSDNEVYPPTYSGLKNVWDDNNSNGTWNEDGLVSLRDTNHDGIADAAYHLYTSNDDPMNPWMWTPHEDQIILSAYTVAAAMQYAADQNWDIEGVDNDGDSGIMYWGDPPDPAYGGDIIRMVNEDWPDGADNDGDCDPDKDGISNDVDSDGVIDGTGVACVDEDDDGMRNDPSPQDGDDDTTNDPMPWNDWNLANKDSVMSSDELYAQRFLVRDNSLAPGVISAWEDEAGVPYYEIPGPKGWPYTYAVGDDDRPWSGDEQMEYYNASDRRDGHLFANGNIKESGEFYFNNEDVSTVGIAADGWGVMADLSEATEVADSSSPSGVRYNFGAKSDTGSAYQTAIYMWTDGYQTNANGETIDWMYMRPKMDSIDYNSDGDWNPATDIESGVRRVPHDRETGGIMSDEDYLALGWDTWRVSYDYQLIIDPLFIWDVEADWARMEGDDDGDGLFNEDGLYSDYFENDGSLKDCAVESDYPCMTMDSSTGILTLHKKDGTTTTSFDISDGVDNDFDDSVDEVEAFDDDGDGSSDEDPVGDPDDMDQNGDTTAPYNDDGDSRTDEDPISYERDRINDHSRWSSVYQGTTDAVVETFYLERDSELTVEDIDIDSSGLLATAVVSIEDTETWRPHNPWGDDFDHDGLPDDVRRETQMMVFKMEKINGKWLLLNIHEGFEDMTDYQEDVASGDVKQFGGMVSKIEMVSPVGDHMTGPATDATTTPTFQWNDSEVSGTIGSYLIHIEEITEDMITNFEQPSAIMMFIIDPLFVTEDSATHIKSFQFGSSGATDVTDAVLAAFSDDPHFPFDIKLTGLSDGGAYSWGILAFSDSSPDFSSGKPEPLGDSFEPMMFATGSLPSYFTGSSTASRLLPKAKVGGTVYNTIPSNIAPSLYEKASDSHRNYGPGSADPRSHR